MTTPLETLLKRLEDVESKATPGPWIEEVGNHVGFLGQAFSQVVTEATDDDGDRTVVAPERIQYADGFLICESRNSLPALLQIIKLQNSALHEIVACRRFDEHVGPNTAGYALSRCDEIAKGVGK